MQHVYEGLSLCCFVYWGQDRPVNKTDGRTPSQLALVGREACRSYLKFKEAEP